MEKVLLGLGSNSTFENLKPCQILFNAVSELESFIKDLRFSSIYRTAAMYVTDQDDFYNMVVAGLFEGTPRELLDKIHLVENAYGRDRSREIRFGPRPLDIDIELFGDEKISERDLVVPHERMLDRSFVLTPFVEILESCELWEKEKMDFYKKRLELLSQQRIDLFISKEEFLEIGERGPLDKK